MGQGSRKASGGRFRRRNGRICSWHSVCFCVAITIKNRKTMKNHILSLALMLACGTASAQFAMPALPYSANALSPRMSAETVNYHYGKHVRTYVDNLNALTKGGEWEGVALEEIVKSGPEGPIFNNAAQILNHALFFGELSPAPQAGPAGVLEAAIIRDFGSAANFKAKFTAASAALFGSGWVWLAVDAEGFLKIVPLSNAGNPLREGLTPLMGIDVWEHAYYLDYRNRRADYIKAFWEMLDWKVVAQRFEALGLYGH